MNGGCGSLKIAYMQQIYLQMRTITLLMPSINLELDLITPVDFWDYINVSYSKPKC